jgi:hypothetical protein
MERRIVSPKGDRYTANYMQLVGIDFSGDVRRWTAGTRRSNVWIACSEYEDKQVQVHKLIRVQELDYPGHPFDRLCRFISDSDDARVAIDAPFSIPRRFLHVAPEIAWSQVAALAREERPFPASKPFLQLFCPNSPDGLGYHIWRNTEQYWRDHHVNVRSTLSAKHRGGAATTAACMTLLATHSGPIWPFRNGGVGAVVCEAFPAAQLCNWELNYSDYNGDANFARGIRSKILSFLIEQKALRIDEERMDSCLKSADALDAVLCLYAAAAVSSRSPPKSEMRCEGKIVVHD